MDVATVFVISEMEHLS